MWVLFYKPNIFVDDGKHPCLTCATTAGKLFIHDPHSKDEDKVKFLNINRDVTALCTGSLNPKQNNDVLFIGTGTNLAAYDVEKNADIFFTEVSDGLNTMTFGKIGTIDSPLILVGGNCAVQGFGNQGTEEYWTTTGGNVQCLVLIDIEEDGYNELLVGTDDYNIYIYQEEEVYTEISESYPLHQLCRMYGTKFGFSLQNGTVGVYDKDQRLWKIKSKNQINAIEGFDLDGDGVPELITGWSNGRFEVRDDKNGMVIYKENFESPIASILQGDYKLDGKMEVICCCQNGNVRGYLPAEKELRDRIDTSAEEEAIKELNNRKQELLYQLNNLEENLKKLKSGETDAGMINPTTKVTCHLKPNAKKNCVDMIFQTDNSSVIKAAILCGEHIFKDDIYMIYAENPTNTLVASLKPEKDISAILDMSILVGYKLSTKYHVFEMRYKLPKFSMYIPCPNFDKNIESYVTFKVSERINRIIMWLNSSFNIAFEDEHISSLDIRFVSLRDGSPLQILFDHGTVTIKVDDMGIAGEIIQDLCAYLKIKELESIANFPKEFEELRKYLIKVNEHNATRLKLTAEMANNAHTVKAYVVKAEDARILNDMEMMRKYYNELYGLNRELMGEYVKRSNNHQELLSSLKQVNHMIQKAARLRYGNIKTKIVNDCREAIKQDNIANLFKIIQGKYSTN